MKSLNFKKTKVLTAKCLNSSSGNSKFATARRIAEMCCIDLQPFHIVKREGFRKYITHIDPTVTFPTAKTVATTALNDVYDVYFEAIKDILLKCPNNINLVLDMWTDRFKKISYINIKIHFAEEFSLKCVSLKTEHFPHPHTGKAVGEKVLQTLQFFKLENKKIRAVSDGGSNIVSAMKIQNIERFGCLAHTLHRFLTYDILTNPLFSSLNQIILKLKNIFRAVTYRGEEIEKIQTLKENQNLYEIIRNI